MKFKSISALLSVVVLGFCLNCFVLSISASPDAPPPGYVLTEDENGEPILIIDTSSNDIQAAADVELEDYEIDPDEGEELEEFTGDINDDSDDIIIEDDIDIPDLTTTPAVTTTVQTTTNTQATTTKAPVTTTAAPITTTQAPITQTSTTAATTTTTELTTTEEITQTTESTEMVEILTQTEDTDIGVGIITSDDDINVSGEIIMPEPVTPEEDTKIDSGTNIFLIIIIVIILVVGAPVGIYSFLYFKKKKIYQY